MKQPTLFHGITTALLFTVLSVPVAVTINVFFSPWFVPRVFIGMLVSGYIIYILNGSSQRVGRVALGLGTLCLVWLMIIFGSSVMHLALVALIAISITRSVLSYSSIISWVMDLCLVIVGAACAFSAFLAGANVFIAIWCFFLIQALTVMIPEKMGGPFKKANDKKVSEDGGVEKFDNLCKFARGSEFERAEKAAEQAIAAIIQASV